MEKMEKPVAAKPNKPNIWLIVSIILAIGLVIVIGVVLTKSFSANKAVGSKMVTLTSDQAGSKLLSFVNEVYGAQVGPATLKGVSETNGVYEVTLTIMSQGQPTDQKVYITKDGTLFMPQAMNIADILTQYQTYKQQQEAQAQQGTQGTAETQGTDTTDTAPVEIQQ